jgi:hypothetical protein
MPFTPFHFGPAALLKGILPTRFSFLVFCYAQVLIDLEVAYYISIKDPPLHRLAHTYVGALLAGLVCGLTGPWLHRLAVRYSQRSPYKSLIFDSLSIKVSITSALLGTVSHVFFDSIMHRDMEPLWPFSEGNVLRGVLPLSALHLLCMTTGILGLIWCSVLAKRSITTQGSRSSSAGATDDHSS